MGALIFHDDFIRNFLWIIDISVDRNKSNASMFFSFHVLFEYSYTSTRIANGELPMPILEQNQNR